MSPQRRRNIYGLLLITLIVIPTFSTILWLNHQRKEVKREVKHLMMVGISPDELVELSFSISDAATILKWKKKHEFEYKGQMYDVVSKVVDGEIITFWCWLDKKETALNAKLDCLLQIALSGNKEKRSKENQLDTFFKSLVFQPTNYLSERDLNQEVDYADVLPFFENIHLKEHSPPPEVI